MDGFVNGRIDHPAKKRQVSALPDPSKKNDIPLSQGMQGIHHADTRRLSS
jgi:hypothetical protein